MNSNQSIYRSIQEINYYLSYSRVQPPERTIFAELEQDLAKIKMLDIGIGGGRTTSILASKVAGYTGIDYSQEMVDAAKRRFPSHDIRWGDATHLSSFADESFDLTLFSFNGLDCVGAAERQNALAEMFRVTKKGGRIIFSTHNILSLPNLNRVRLHRDPRVVIRRIFRRLKYLRINRQVLSQPLGDIVFLLDGTHDFQMELAYVNTRWQYGVLEKLGCASIRTFELTHGLEINKAQLETDRSTWIYFLCIKA